MSTQKQRSAAAFVGRIAIGLAGLTPAVAGESPEPSAQSLYAPVQNVSHEFGSKWVSGYFVEYSATCLVNLMIMEKSALETPSAASPTRVRLVLYPGQIAGLDSEEGRSLNFTCGDGATSLAVDTGGREALVAAQSFSVHRSVAKTQ